MTEWRPIPGIPKYEASDGGEIRNAKTGKILKPFNDPLQEYDRVSFYMNGRKKKYLVHYLVARTFLGEPPQGEYHIDHKNTNIHDNRPCNLQYVTPTKNYSNPITQFNREVARIRRAIASGRKSQEDILELVNSLKKL